MIIHIYVALEDFKRAKVLICKKKKNQQQSSGPFFSIGGKGARIWVTWIISRISFQREGRGGFTLNTQSLVLFCSPWRSLLNLPSSLSALPSSLRAPLPKGPWKMLWLSFLLSPTTLHSVQHVSVTFMASTPFITSEMMASRRRLGVFVWEESGEGLASLSSLGVTCLWLRWA